MKRYFNLAAATVAVLLGIGAHAAHAADTLKLGFMPFVPYSASLVAKQNGWVEEELKKEGLGDVSVKWVQFAGGPPVNEAMASHNIDIAALGDTPALVGRASGIDDRMIGLSYKGGAAQALVVRSDSPIKSIDELKGKKVATLRGGNVHELLVLILQSAGLKLSDVEFVNLGLDDMGTALLKGDIDAALVWDPVFVRLDTTHQIRVLRTGAGLKSNLNPIIASADVLKQHPKYVTAYLRAIQRGADELRQHPQAAATQLAPVFGLTPQQTLVAFSRSEFVPPVDASARAELKRSVTFLQDNRLTRNAVDVDTFIDIPAAH
ncbi:aliphatic sulfonate ABC transporter substrate-binding protein [Paraburkholderia unamae]|uniref:Sulfonate transport system substrate-binding protein n=1 Tax=Paraburkholderia unamae TaxID=219649 RepID=A0ABX5KTF4_9BURK|nr:aliphatic sulfonate ABC transporter substrate-binding protein [Paraburkholderia unamae]PVX85549.1 sulfonate transport system substrate-binding protein [Paraburkholderia unamae]RAR55242.1 sulfonate transport system substrate-binding protein [Paraburkholderia unamae]